MFDNFINFFKKGKKKELQSANSKDAAKERLHLVLMQDRANVSADFLDLMRQEIVEVIKKYIDIDEDAMDVRLTNQENEDGTQGAPALYANIPIVNIKDEVRKLDKQQGSAQNSHNIENNKKTDVNQIQENEKKEDSIKDTLNNEKNVDNTENKIEKKEFETDEKDIKKEQEKDDSKIDNLNQNTIKKDDEVNESNNNDKNNFKINKTVQSNNGKNSNVIDSKNKTKTEDDKK